MIRKTQDGFDALQWCGQRPCVSAMCRFTGFDTQAICPGGDLIIEVPGNNISVKPGQWVVKKGEELQIVDGDKIVFAP